ncbi:MAG: hypothetical protein GY711_10595 [bacterium]|nr:hypothetical protein [bacterium]
MKRGWVRLCVDAGRLEPRARRPITRVQVAAALELLYADEHAGLLREACELRIADRARRGEWRAMLLMIARDARDGAQGAAWDDPPATDAAKRARGDRGERRDRDCRESREHREDTPHSLPWDAWRHRVRAELATARGDGVAPPAELDACTPWPPSAWGTGAALTLARAARSVADGPESRRAEIRALAAGGRTIAAGRALHRLQCRGWRGEVDDPVAFARELDVVRVIVLEGRGELARAAELLERVLHSRGPRRVRALLAAWRRGRTVSADVGGPSGEGR